MTKLVIQYDHLQEIKDLVETGDVSLNEYRGKFKASQGRDTTLNDENLIRAIAATDDDDDELFVKNALIAESEQVPA